MNPFPQVKSDPGQRVGAATRLKAAALWPRLRPLTQLPGGSRGRPTQTDTHKTVPRARPGDGEMTPDEKMDTASRTEGRGGEPRRGKERGRVTRYETRDGEHWAVNTSQT
ncbi:unnamed protein product [Pleuronectes platessa]|uniref:Uncharacterized protein n=1 Tax=Pleuronectes platessa TaxID=8262 RepID=A0A9N7VEL5_PLEPL|nr:unnamed protein product [Pleuronectes platessa]